MLLYTPNAVATDPGTIFERVGWQVRWCGPPGGSCNAVSDHERLDSDIVWTALRAEVESGHVDFILARPPSSTFSAGRHHSSGPHLSAHRSILMGFPGACFPHARGRKFDWGRIMHSKHFHCFRHVLHMGLVLHFSFHDPCRGFRPC